jgi:hypothetical protein
MLLKTISWASERLHAGGNAGVLPEPLAGTSRSSPERSRFQLGEAAPAAAEVTASAAANGDCVEVARPAPGQIAIRDSEDPDGPRLAFTPQPVDNIHHRCAGNASSPA